LCGYIAAGFFNDAAFSGKNGFTIASRSDFCREARHAESRHQFGANCHESPFGTPLIDKWMCKRLCRSVVTDRMTRKAGADQYFAAHGVNL
jgi:hypothetical protein